jgi:L-iditol 2-dehydrogenase
MRQAILVEPHRFLVRDSQTPTPGPDEILVAVEAAGICGSDLHTYHGVNPVIKPPLVMGHECAGTIAQAGSATTLQPGQRIALEPDIPCGKCVYCREGQTHMCTDMRFVGGLSDAGTFADYVVAPASAAVPLPHHVSAEEGAFAEPVTVACHALELVRNVRRDNILVLGAGTIGNLVAQVARLQGARRVGITDIVDSKLDVAREVGIEHTANPAKQNLAAWATDVFGATGPDVTFDCVGLTETVNQGLALTRKCGLVVLVGVSTAQELPIKPMELLLSERGLKGCYIYKHENFIEAVDLLGKGQIKVQPLISKIFGLDEIGRAFAFLDNRANGAIKVLIKP